MTTAGGFMSSNVRGTGPAGGRSGRCTSRGQYTYTLTNAISCHLSNTTLSQDLKNALIEQVKGIWNYEVTLYRNAHPEFQSPPVPSRQGQLQRVLPVSEALFLGHRLVTIGLHRIYMAVTENWVNLQLPGSIEDALEGPIFEEE